MIDRFRNYKILLVDDNKTNLELLNGILFGNGYIVFVAQNGEQALQIATEKLPDLIILDVAMPGMDGFEVCTELKSIPETSEISVIFLTAVNEKNDIERGLSMGAADYITKPFEIDIVTQKIRNHLEFKRQKDILKKEREEADEQIFLRTKLFALLSQEMAVPIKQSEEELENIVAEDRLPDEDVLRNLLEKIRETIHKTSDQLEKINNLAGIINNEIKADIRKFDLDPLIMRNVKAYMREAKSKGITLLYENPGPKPILADIKLVDILIKNLLSNAMSHTHSGGDIIISASIEGNLVTTTVYDTGSGMDSETAAHIFDPDLKYAILNNKHVGLGLGIVAHFVKLCHGKIWVESMPGIGSDFKFSLPYAISDF